MAEDLSPMQDYVERLKYHDWYYVYSDDSRVYRRGAEAEKALSALQKQLDPDYKIWNEHAPEQYKVKPAKPAEKEPLKKPFTKAAKKRKSAEPAPPKKKAKTNAKKGPSKK